MGNYHFGKNGIIHRDSVTVCQKLLWTAFDEHCAGLLTRNTTRSCRICGTRRITRKLRRFAPGLLVSTTSANFSGLVADVCVVYD